LLIEAEVKSYSCGRVCKEREREGEKERKRESLLGTILHNTAGGL